MSKKNRFIFNYYAWIYLFFNILTILGGTLVRATDSGAGCGKHWPLCNGVLLPDINILKTFIEFSHRMSSAVLGIGGVILFIWGSLITQKKDIVRFSVSAVLFLIIFEALLGASLVIFGLVENDSSLTRIIVMALHLISTFLLIASVTFTCLWSSKSFAHFSIQQVNTKILRPVLTCIFVLLLISVTGSITALGDTIFKPNYVGENFFKELVDPSHILKFLRGFHPIIAVFGTIYSFSIVLKLCPLHKRNFMQNKINVLTVIFLFLLISQIGVGFINIIEKATLTLQIIHLFIADCIWISGLILFNELLQYKSNQDF